MKCQAKRSDGRPCGAPESLVDESGFCPPHRPGGSQEMRERGRKGAAATKRRWRRDMSLPPLTSFAAAQKWLEVVGRAVAAGHLGPREADAITRAAQSWISSQSGRELEELVGKLKRRIREMEARLEAAGGKR